MFKTKNEKNINSYKLLKKVFNNLSSKYKFYLLIVIILMFVSAILQSLSVFVFAPFINLLLNPKLDIFEKISIDLPLFSAFRFDFSLFEFGLIVIGIITISSLVQIINLRAYANFNRLVVSKINIDLFKYFISLTYQEHIELNSSKYLNLITLQIENASACLLLSLQFLTSLLLGIFLIISIFVVNFKVGFITFLIFGLIYYFLIIKNKDNLNSFSLEISNLNRSQIKSVQEASSSKRDLIIYQLEQSYINNFSKRENSIRKLKIKSLFFANVPKFLIEGLSLIFLVALSLILINNFDQSAISSISLLGAFALASQKLILNIQKLYSAWVNFRFRSNSLDEVLENIEVIKKDKNKQNSHLKKNNKINKNIKFEKSIVLKNIYYSHKESNFSLKNINLEIFKGETIGIIGETGSGKSTLQDILLGLIRPDSGEILIDGNLFKHHDELFMSSWYSLIGHVPQSISIIDGNIKDNICYLNKKKINLRTLKKVSKVAILDKFINSLPNKYYSRIGENGIMISGGQKQRIGIARALYNNPTILFLDEATSALDSKTEFDLIRNINSLKVKPTILMIAHRLETLAYCDRVFKIKNGKLSDATSSLHKK